MNAKSLVTVFGRLYREKVGEQYPPTWGRDLRIFNELLKLYPFERLESLLKVYFGWQRKIYSIPFFKVDLANLIQIEKKEERDTPQPMLDNESWRFE